VRSAVDVVDEIAWLERDYRPDQLAVVDDVFGLQPGWVDSFARLREAANVRLPFRCLMRADQIDSGMVRALAVAGCRMVWMGAESGSQRILDAMEKGTRVEQIRQAVRLLQGAGIEVGLFLQFGYPGEDWDDVEATLGLVRDTAPDDTPDDIGVSVSYPLPGTKFYERVRAELGPKQNWFDSNDLAMLYRATYDPEFYRVLHRVVHHQFRARRQAARLRAVARGGHVARMAALRSAASWLYHRAALPVVQRQLATLARQPRRSPAPARLIPLLTRGAAARPSQQCEDTAS
jgi:anaerobic magnesium-protoporphyrin IX monomethyl ester cyclase